MTKLLIIVLVALAALWLARVLRARIGRGRARPKPPVRSEDMPACAQCGVHLPRSDALPGRGGVFCSEGHRAAYEASHPTP